MEPVECNVKVAQKERFSRICSKYVLIYTAKRDLQDAIGYNEIRESELKYLSHNDTVWLLDCNLAIIAEETEKHKSDVISQMGLMVDRLERALKEEKDKEDAGK
jgi:hypothetical protein